VDWTRIESSSYWIMFVAAFLAFAMWESVRPKRDFRRTEQRWLKHGAMLVICTVISVSIWRVGPVALAFGVRGNRYGLLNQAWMPTAVRFVLAILVLDFVKYLIHRVHHSVFLLWRVHQVHHSDPEFDVSTGLRVHPIEVTISQGVYLLAVAALAPPVMAVLTAELLSAFQSFFSHANASLPGWIERPLRLVLVTPDMHRTHHSVEIQEQYKNLGDIFPWWDRLCGTYLETPAAGDEGVVTGLKGCEGDTVLGVRSMLAQPFRKEAAQAADVSATAASA